MDTRSRLGGGFLGLLFGLVAVLGLTGPAAAQEAVKMAVVDARRAMVSSNEGKAAEKVLKDLMERKRKTIEPLESELKKQQEEFEAQKYVLSPGALEERRMELVKRQRDLERDMREAQDELEMEQRRLMQPLLKDVEEVLVGIGKEKGFTVILERSSPGVLYTTDSIDITDLVIQRLNAK